MIKKWLGMILMAVSFGTGVITKVMMDRGMISVELSEKIIPWVFILFIPGFILHMAVVAEQLREKRRKEKK